MNNSRRKRINGSIMVLKEAQAKLEVVLREEQIALTMLSDDEEYNDMRNGMEEIITGLEELMPTLQDAIDSLEGADF